MTEVAVIPGADRIIAELPPKEPPLCKHKLLLWRQNPDMRISCANGVRVCAFTAEAPL